MSTTATYDIDGLTADEIRQLRDAVAQAAPISTATRGTPNTDLDALLLHLDRAADAKAEAEAEASWYWWTVTRHEG